MKRVFDVENEWLHLAELWIFADKIGSFGFSNDVNDAIFTLTNVDKQPLMSAAEIVFVYRHTTPSPLKIIPLIKVGQIKESVVMH